METIYVFLFDRHKYYTLISLHLAKYIQRDKKQLIEEPPGLAVPNGTVAREADSPPGYTTAMPLGTARPGGSSMSCLYRSISFS
jgi:hypothetical protein